jgi:hypothetical protein
LFVYSGGGLRRVIRWVIRVTRVELVKEEGRYNIRYRVEGVIIYILYKTKVVYLVYLVIAIEGIEGVFKDLVKLFGLSVYLGVVGST